MRGIVHGWVYPVWMGRLLVGVLGHDGMERVRRSLYTIRGSATHVKLSAVKAMKVPIQSGAPRDYMKGKFGRYRRLHSGWA